MATESKANKNVTATCIVQVVRLISLKLLKLATHETLNADWGTSGIGHILQTGPQYLSC